MQMIFLQTVLPIILWQFTVFLWKFDLPQVNWDLISSIINFAYELSHDLPNNLSLRVLEN